MDFYESWEKQDLVLSIQVCAFVQQSEEGPSVAYPLPMDLPLDRSG